MAAFPTGGAITATQMCHKESGSYPGAEVKEKSQGFAPVAPSPLGLGSHKVRMFCPQAYYPLPPAPVCLLLSNPAAQR